MLCLPLFCLSICLSSFVLSIYLTIFLCSILLYLSLMSLIVLPIVIELDFSECSVDIYELGLGLFSELAYIFLL